MATMHIFDLFCLSRSRLLLCSDPLVVEVLEEIETCVVPISDKGALGRLHELRPDHRRYIIKRLQC